MVTDIEQLKGEAPAPKHQKLPGYQTGAALARLFGEQLRAGALTIETEVIPDLSSFGNDRYVYVCCSFEGDIEHSEAQGYFRVPNDDLTVSRSIGRKPEDRWIGKAVTNTTHPGVEHGFRESLPSILQGAIPHIQARGLTGLTIQPLADASYFAPLGVVTDGTRHKVLGYSRFSPASN